MPIIMIKKTGIVLVVLLTSLYSFSQKVTGKVLLQQGQAIDIHVDLKTTVSQEAGDRPSILLPMEPPTIHSGSPMQLITIARFIMMSRKSP